MAIKASNGTGGVVIRDGGGCAPSSVRSLTLTGNAGGVSVVGDSVGGAVRVVGNSGGVTVTGNTISGSLTVLENLGTVLDTPNKAGGKTKLQ